MGYGILNIWLRDEDCSLLKAWNVKLYVRTCSGESLFSMLTKPELESIREDLKEMYPDCTVSVDTSCVMIGAAWQNTIINHIHLAVPPGCYVINADICHEKNEETDKMMVVVNCGEEVCMNLILKDVESCIHGVLVPFVRVAVENHLPIPDIQVAVDMLRTVGKVPVSEIQRVMEEKVALFKEYDVGNNAISQTEAGLKIIKNLRMKAKK